MEMFFVCSLFVSCFAGGMLAENVRQRQIQDHEREQRYDRNERTLRRVVQYLNDIAPAQAESV